MSFWSSCQRPHSIVLPALVTTTFSNFRESFDCTKSFSALILHIVVFWLNCGEGAWWKRREPQASLEGNHDNPVSSTHEARSHWEHQWRNGQKNIQRGEGTWGKTAKATARKGNVSKMIDFCESAVQLLKPCYSLGPPHIRLVVETAGQHCLVFNVAWITFSHINSTATIVALKHPNGKLARKLPLL